MRTLADQQAALDTAVVLARTFGHLPAAYIAVSPVYPSQIDIGLHEGLGDFETWREALGLPSGDVEYRTYGGVFLRVRGKSLGANVEITGYAPALAEPEVES
ncbi:hypothetical protein ACH4GK_31960 [Streptomyces rimosus]|uniref:hypothetical protein n=1 Tax=Streptomyces rimosus TaxID=1927 RepID=UPI0004C60D51|nr:hypothetical protein [Streptomyces rimosus]